MYDNKASKLFAPFLKFAAKNISKWIIGNSLFGEAVQMTTNTNKDLMWFRCDELGFREVLPSTKYAPLLFITYSTVP